MSPITTHVLDTALGRPAAGIAVHFARQNADGTWTELTRAATNNDGRIPDFISPELPLPAGIYRMRFMTEAYFAAHGIHGFYPEVPVHFHFDPAGGHYHVPLLLSPFGYSTYRGS